MVVLTFELRERDGFIEGLYVVFSCLVGCSTVFNFVLIWFRTLAVLFGLGRLNYCNQELIISRR